MIRPLRQIAVTAVLDERRKRGPRRAGTTQAIGVPSYSRIVFKSGSAVVR